MATKESIIELLKKLHALTTEISTPMHVELNDIEPLHASSTFLNTMTNLIQDTSTNLEPIHFELEVMYKQLQHLRSEEFSRVWERLVSLYPFKKGYEESMKELCNHQFVKSNLFKSITSVQEMNQDTINIIYMWLICHVGYIEFKDKNTVNHGNIQ
jgi:DNA repair ATPase RecN